MRSSQSADPHFIITVRGGTYFGPDSVEYGLNRVRLEFSRSNWQAQPILRRSERARCEGNIRAGQVVAR